MTPAQRKYDLDLARNMIGMAKWIEPRSRKVSQALMVAAQRITALSSEASGFDPSTPIVTAKQPASTPSKKR